MNEYVQKIYIIPQANLTTILIFLPISCIKIATCLNLRAKNKYSKAVEQEECTNM